MDFCRKVKGLDDEIQKAREEVQNLGLINTLSDYETLRSAKPQSKSQREYLKYFKEAFNSLLMHNARTKMQRFLTRRVKESVVEKRNAGQVATHC